MSLSKQSAGALALVFVALGTCVRPCCAAALLCQEASEAPRPASSADDLRQRAELALKRDPRQLPVAPAERWLKWTAKEPIPAGMQREVVAGMRAYTAQDYAASLAFLYALLEREPDFPPALYQAGLCYFRLRRYGDCAALFERFVRAAPTEIGATQALGHCYYSLGDYSRARAHYEKVLALQPTSADALRGLALSEMRMGNNPRALELLAKVLELRPDHADAHAWCAQILFDEGDVGAALLHAERSRDLEPWEPRPWFLLSRIFGELEREAEAQKARERFELISRVDQQVRQQQGLLLHEPARADLWVQLIALQRSVDNRPGVRDGLQHLSEFSPADTRTALFLVDGFDWLGDRSRAQAAALHAESVAGSDPKALAWLADYYKRVGDSAGEARTRTK